MTKEDLMQISELMDQKLQAQKQDISELIEQKLKAQKQEIIKECTANMNVIIESQVQTQMNLIFEKVDMLEKKMVTKDRVDEFEERIDSRFDILETAVKYHGSEINRLKKAQ